MRGRKREGTHRRRTARQRCARLLVLVLLSSLGTLGAALVTESPLAAQIPGLPGQSDSESEDTPEVPVVLPTTGLFERETWVGLGRDLVERLVEWIPALVAALIVLSFFLLLAWVAGRTVHGIVSRTKADPSLRKIASRMVSYAILILGLIMAAAQAGLQVGSLLAGVGIVGLAVGLAAQESLANIVAGLIIFWDRPFRTGDNVTIAETFGEVKEIRIRTTRIRTVDSRDVILPNKQVVEGKISNHTLSPQLRLDINLGIAYWEDSRHAREVLLATLVDHPLLEAGDKHDVVMTELADSSVNLQLRVWIKNPKQERAAFFSVIERAKIALDEAGIEIPFPQRTLHLAKGTSLQVGSNRATAEDASGSAVLPGVDRVDDGSVAETASDR